MSMTGTYTDKRPMPRKWLLVITPAIPLDDRHKLQDAIRSLGYDVTGGGQIMDGSGCDISFKESGA